MQSRAVKKNFLCECARISLDDDIASFETVQKTSQFVIGATKINGKFAYNISPLQICLGSSSSVQ